MVAHRQQVHEATVDSIAVGNPACSIESADAIDMPNQNAVHVNKMSSNVPKPPSTGIEKGLPDASTSSKKFPKKATLFLVVALTSSALILDTIIAEFTASHGSDGNSFLQSFPIDLVICVCAALVVVPCMLLNHFRSGGGAKESCTGSKPKKVGLAHGSGDKRAESPSENLSARPSQGVPGAIPGGSTGTSRERNGVLHVRSMVDQAARAGDPERAGRLLDNLERTALKPDAVLFNMVMRAFAKRADVQGAEKWFARMKTADIAPTLCSYNTVMDACAKAGRVRQCEAWFGRMRDAGIEGNAVTYATVIFAQARQGDLARAEAVLQEMEAAGVVPDAVCYNALIHACAVKGSAEGAGRWINVMRSKGLEVSVTTFTAAIDACAKAGDLEQAEAWMVQMIAADLTPNVVTFSALIDTCAKLGNRIRAEHWYGRMLEAGVQPNGHSFSSLITACARAGDVDTAERWLARAQAAGAADDPVLYSGLIDACGKVKDADRAMAVFRQMQANGVRPHVVTFASLARPFAYRGEWATVEGLAQEMEAAGIAPNEYFLYAQLLAYASSRPKEPTRAETAFRKGMLNGLMANDHVLGALMRAMGRSQATKLTEELGINSNLEKRLPAARGVPCGQRVW